MCLLQNGFEDDDLELGDHFELSTQDDQHDVIDEVHADEG
jgi:hypothetical protein